MNRFYILAVVMLFLLFGEYARAIAEKPIQHSFLCSDPRGNKFASVSADGKVLWEYPAEMTQDIWKLPNGNILFSYARGARIITPNSRQVIWEYRSPDGTEVHTCQPLPGGNVLVGECGSKTLVEVNVEGKAVKVIPFQANSDTHSQLRFARKLKNGNYLLALYGDQVVKELAPDGKELRTISVPGGPYCALRLKNGNTLISAGDAHRIIEVDKKDKVVWSIEEKELPGNTIQFAGGLQRLPNGNTVVCNWTGHSNNREQPLLFEVTRDKRVVWKYEQNPAFTTIMGITLLDVKGDVTKGQIIR